MKKFKNYITPVLALILSTAALIYLARLIAAGQLSFPIQSLFQGNFVNVLILLIMSVSFAWMFVASLVSVFSKVETVYRKKNKIIGLLFIPIILVIAIWSVLNFYANSVYVGDPVAPQVESECPAGFIEC